MIPCVRPWDVPHETRSPTFNESDMGQTVHAPLLDIRPRGSSMANREKYERTFIEDVL
jgi:hypothetical protein